MFRTSFEREKRGPYESWVPKVSNRILVDVEEPRNVWVLQRQVDDGLMDAVFCAGCKPVYLVLQTPLAGVKGKSKELRGPLCFCCAHTRVQRFPFNNAWLSPKNDVLSVLWVGFPPKGQGIPSGDSPVCCVCPDHLRRLVLELVKVVRLHRAKVEPLHAAQGVA